MEDTTGTSVASRPIIVDLSEYGCFDGTPAKVTRDIRNHGLLTPVGENARWDVVCGAAA
jgi:hypothetical protein